MPAEDGFVATPEPLADVLAAEVLLTAPEPGDRILYPGAGTGNIAAAVHRRCSVRGHDAPDGVAVEIDADRAAQLRDRLAGDDATANHGVPEMSEDSREWHTPSYPPSLESTPREPQPIDADIEVVETDLLLDPPNGEFDYIVANPPYVRYNEIDSDDREVYATVFDTATGQYDLYMPFVEQMLRLLASDGLLVFLAPGNYLTKPKGRPLRQLLRHYNPYTPRDIPGFAFPDHTVRTVMTGVARRENDGFSNPTPPSETELYVTHLDGFNRLPGLAERYGFEDGDWFESERYDSYLDWFQYTQHRVRRAEREDREEGAMTGDVSPSHQSNIGAWS